MLLGWSEHEDHYEEYGTLIRTTVQLKRSVLLARCTEDLLQGPNPPDGPIDVWWRGRQHGPLMLLLAHLISQTPAWQHRSVRLLHAVRKTEEEAEAMLRMEELIHNARIRAEARVVVTNAFPEALRTYSADSALVFLGFIPPAKGTETTFMEQTGRLMEGLRTVILVNSTGGVSLDA